MDILLVIFFILNIAMLAVNVAISGWNWGIVSAFAAGFMLPILMKL